MTWKHINGWFFVDEGGGERWLFPDQFSPSNSGYDYLLAICLTDTEACDKLRKMRRIIRLHRTPLPGEPRGKEGEAG